MNKLFFFDLISNNDNSVKLIFYALQVLFFLVFLPLFSVFYIGRLEN